MNVDRSSIPHSPGIYLMRDSSARILYVGKARDLAKRVASYFQDRLDLPVKTAALVSTIHHIDYIPAASEREALVLEQDLIRRLQPPFNVMWKDDKSYPFVKLTWGEDFPRLFLTRRRPRDGSKYFGPFPNVSSVRKLLKFLWRRRAFPLRPCRYEFSVEKPLDPDLIKGCLYYHTKECPAPCAGRINRADYRAIAREAEMFFKGSHRRLAKVWESEMREASAARDFERAAQLRDNLQALRHLNERVTIRRLEPEQIADRVDQSRSITELQKVLGLPKPPLRIECFDISHFQGVETVASLVVFERGRPKKEDYRKFKIKTVKGIDDFASMGEVVGRRYRRLRNEGRTLPDLILIDGGKGQLSAALKAIYSAVAPASRKPGSSVLNNDPGSRLTIRRDDSKKWLRLPFAVVALAKQEEELFMPGRDEPVRLPADSPARQLVEHIRNEAHRFAITFHRHRRAKRFLKQ